MAIVRMKPFFVVGSLGCERQFVSALQKCGCVEIRKSGKVAQSGVDLADSNEIADLSDMVSKVDAAILGLQKFCRTPKPIVNFKKPVPYGALKEIEPRLNSLLKKVEEVNFCCEQIDRNSAKVSELENKKTGFLPFLKFNFPLRNFETKFTKCCVGVCVGRLRVQKLNQLFANEAYFEIVEVLKSQTVLFVVSLKSKFDQIKKILAKLKFSALSPDFESDLTAKQCFSSCCDQIKRLDGQNSDLKLELKKNVKFLDDFKLLFDFLSLKLDQKRKLFEITKTKSTFFLDGYLNPLFESKFEGVANKFGIYYEIKGADASSPVDFENCSFVAPVEAITKTYSMPAQIDVDPNPVMAFFYYMFFGIMFSDAGYGLIMAAVCSVFAFLKKVDKLTKQKFRMFFWCGVSTVFWGLMFGSFFGDFIGVASKMFFGSSFVFSPIFLDSLNEPMKLLGFSLFVGLIQVLIGVFVGFVAVLKAKNFKEAFFSRFSWFLVLLGVCLCFVCLLFVKIAVFEFLGYCFCATGAAMVLLFSGYQKKGMFRKVLSGILGLYGSVSYVGDVLSYCRLMALSIATGVVANVVNLLSSMMCVNFFGFCAFLVIFVFGHLMNFGINALGAYVHTVRLQYVEFFSKFYEGGGRLFLPYGLNITKYFEIEADSD